MDHETSIALNFLLKASSRDVVVRLCNEAFINRSRTSLPDDVVKSASDTLGVSSKDATKLLVALRQVVKSCLFRGSSDPRDILSLFPDGFHKNLRDLLTKVLAERMPEWRNHAVNNLVSLPRLVDFDWRVDVKTSAESLARMSVPTCLVQLKVQESLSDSAPDPSIVNVELSKETLDTMLDGLGKIRDQLNSVTSRS